MTKHINRDAFVIKPLSALEAACLKCTLPDCIPQRKECKQNQLLNDARRKRLGRRGRPSKKTLMARGKKEQSNAKKAA
ncbi:MAG: hypothetical protein AAF512_17685 [Pseudomonadota bacterium]